MGMFQNKDIEFSHRDVDLVYQLHVLVFQFGF